MKSRRILLLLVIAVLSIGSVAAPVSAGGWATVELSKPVDSAVVGEAVDFEFVVLQHGVSKYEGDAPTLTAIHAESGEKIEASAVETVKGLYSATITFDQPGRWKLRAESGVFGTSSSFPTLHVTDKGTVSTPSAESKPAKTTEVQLINFSFVPSLVEIGVAEAVTFTNVDAVKHEVAFYEDTIDDAGILDYEESFTVVFTEAGEYHVACGPHPGMSGMIRVK
jgi:plastocyanin